MTDKNKTKKQLIRKEKLKDEDRFTCLYNSSKDAIKWADLDGMLLDINDDATVVVVKGALV